MRLPQTILWLLLPLLGYTQTPTGNIQKDTSLANQYYAEAIQLIKAEDTTSKAFDLLDIAILHYESHPFDVKQIEIQGRYAMYLSAFSKEVEAKSKAEKIIELATQKGLENHPNTAYAYYTLGEVYSSSDFDKSIFYNEKAFQVGNKNTDLYFETGLSLILAYSGDRRLEQLNNLIGTLENTLEQITNPNLKKYQIYIDFGKVRFFAETRNYEKALLYSAKMEADNEKYQLIKNATLTNYYISLGYLHFDHDNFSKALVYMKKAKETVKHRSHLPAYGHSYNRLARVYVMMNDYENTLKNAQKAIECFSKDEENFGHGLSISYAKLAENELKKGDLDQALAYHQKSRTYHMDPSVEFQMGSIRYARKEYKESVAAYHNLLLMLCSVFDTTDIYQNPSEYETCTYALYKQITLSKKGQSFLRWGESEGDIEKIKIGLSLLERAIKMQEEAWQQAKGFDKSQYYANMELLGALAEATDGYRKVYELAPTDVAFNILYQTTQKQKAIQLIEILTPSLLPEAVFMKEQGLLKTMQTIGQQLDLAKSSQDKDSIRFYQNKLLKVNYQLENHLTEVNQKYPKQANHFYNAQYATLAETQAILPKNTLLITYSMATDNNEESYNVVLTIGNKSKSVTKINSDNLAKDIKTLNKLIQNRAAFQKPVRERFIEVSHRLYNQLLKPIATQLEGKERLMIVVENELFNLPFEVLLAAKDKKPYNELDFLIKKYEINYHYSATAYSYLKDKQTPQDKSLLAFAPVFNKGETLADATRSLDFMVDSIYRSFEKGEFLALPSTKKEVKTIASAVKSNKGTTNVLLQKKATKNQLFKALEQQGYQYIHIATHGLVNFKNPKLSALACYVNDETDENFMYSNEIQFKDINADLVVLSSCESGIGQLVIGEGLIAFNRSFIYSGAKNVLFSLWKVSDKYSSQLMIDFYKQHLSGQSYTSAIRQAKLNMLTNKTTAQPKYWAAFVLMGE